MTADVLQRKKHQCAGLRVAETRKPPDIEENKESGLFTLCFMDSKRNRYKANMEKFKIYSKLSPVISRGRGADKVLVAFHMKATGLSTAKEKGGETPIAKEDASD